MISKRYYSVFSLGFLLLLPSMGLAQTNYTAEVLTKGAGARPLAMGGAFVAAASDATAAYWNPAGLALIDDVEITTMHSPENDLQSYDFINIAFKTDAGSYALSYMRLGVDGIQTEGVVDGEPVPGPVVSIADQAGLLSGGWKVGKNFAVGTTIKFLKSDYYTASAFGIGMDVGAIFKPFKELSIGLVGRDVTGGTHVNWSGSSTEQDVLEPSVTLGLAYTQEFGKRTNDNNVPVPVSTLSVNLDVDSLYLNQGLNNYHLGVEYWYKQFVAIRGGIESKGFKFDSDNFSPSVGVGLWAYLFEIDYAFVSNPLNGGLHYISLITRL